MYYNFIRFRQKLKPEILEELSLSEFNEFWLDVCSYEMLSEPFIEKYQNKLGWNQIFEYQNLSLEFLVKHKDKIQLKYLKRNCQTPQETKDKFMEITNKNI